MWATSPDDLDEYSPVVIMKKIINITYDHFPDHYVQADNGNYFLVWFWLGPLRGANLKRVN
jgi:hypothetical protein